MKFPLKSVKHSSQSRLAGPSPGFQWMNLPHMIATFPLVKGNMLVIVYRCLTFLACLILCLTGDFSAQAVSDSPGQVWQVGARRWDATEELRFAVWVEKTISEDFFLQYGIPVDCADVPYALRWIYARMAHLPAAATTRDGRLFGHWSTAWANQPTNEVWYRDQRFRMALLHMLAETSTKTLPADTYPIRITSDSVLAGTVFIGDGHAGMVGRIVLDGSMFSPVQTWESTLPRRITKLRQRSYFFGWPNADAGSGLMRFCWPISPGGQWRYLPRQEHPYYSDEQYSPGFYHTGELFDEAVARRIDSRRYDPAEKAGMMISSIYHYLEERVALVHEGYRHCRRVNCTEGSSLWEMYSTPGRDDMISFEIEHLVKIIKANRLNEEAIKKTMEGMVIHIDSGKMVTLNYVMQNSLWLSHDPGDSIEARWGLRKCDMIRSRMRNSLQDLDFVEQRYRVTDPHYADNSRSLRFTDLRWLQEEGKRAGCNDLPPLP
jgi:hypothetical protein